MKRSHHVYLDFSPRTDMNLVGGVFTWTFASVENGFKVGD